MWGASMEAAKEGLLWTPMQILLTFFLSKSKTKKKLEVVNKEVNTWENVTNNIFKHEGYN